MTHLHACLTSPPHLAPTVPHPQPDTPTTPDPSPLPVPCPSASLTAHAAPVACLALAPSSPSDVTRPCASVDEGGHAIVWDVGSM